MDGRLYTTIGEIRDAQSWDYWYDCLEHVASEEPGLFLL
jgi:hypothetical protein